MKKLTLILSLFSLCTILSAKPVLLSESPCEYIETCVGFDSGSAGKSGYLFYDWEGNGHYDHVEFCRINSDGSSYSYYSNNGFEGAGNEIYKTNISFKNDSNAHAQVFVP
ncbi:MAG: hypothetical protein SPL22_01655 [Treponema sp.]|uniref:hypothetical protein n=1 Tax=Treponema sp. TaxID=166 RepID=UPI002A9134CA|nr:hypothetical protein [Treponema sp.]MDY6396408.1 hypothetical protein [Treponema sp.]